MPKPTPEQFEQSYCHICKETFKANETRGIGHDHFTGEPSGKTNNNCKLAVKEPRSIPILAHNSSKYDNLFFYQRTFRNKRS